MSRRPSDDLMDPFSDDDIGAIEDAAGDELDLAEAIGRAIPSSDQLQHFADMRGVKHALLDKQAPFARINPPSILKGTLGNVATIQPVAAVHSGGFALPRSKVVEVAAWSGDDAETLPVTVAVDLVNTEIFIGSFCIVKPVAILQFGTRASLFTVEIDVGNGFQLTVPASMVTLRLFVESVEGAAVAPPPPLTLAGMLSFHPIVRTQNVTRTVVQAGSLPAVFANQRIPNFSKSVNLQHFSTANAASTFDLYDSSGYALASVTIPAAATAFMTPIPIPDGAVQWAWYHAGAVFVLGSVIFNLDL